MLTATCAPAGAARTGLPGSWAFAAGRTDKKWQFPLRNREEILNFFEKSVMRDV